MSNDQNVSRKKKNYSNTVINFFQSFPNIETWVEAFLLVLFFLYYWLIVHPEYIQFVQQPIFFLEKRFFFEKLQLPGGILDFAAAFFTEAFQYSWAGALLLTLPVLAAYVLLKAIIRPTVWWIVSVAPVLFLFFAQTNYYYFFVKSLSVVLALTGIMLFKKYESNTLWKNLVLVASISLVIYFLSPGAMVISSFVLFFYTILSKKQLLTSRVVLPFAVTAITAFLPWIAQKEFYLVSIESAYLRHTPLWISDTTDLAPLDKIYLEVTADITIVVVTIFSFLKLEFKKNILKSSLAKNALQISIVVAMLFWGAWKFVDGNQKEFSAIRYNAHMGDWRGVAEQVNNHSTMNILNLFHINRALYHSGALGSDFFTINKAFGGHGLVPKKETWYQYPLDYSDFVLELAHVNESKRWAYEALTHYGESAEVLKRLALTHIIEGDFLAANKFLNRLAQNPFYASWVNHYRSLLADSSLLLSDSYVQYLRTRMPKNDFVVKDDRLELDLREILSQYPDNRMAFEYLLMSSLVTRNINGFIYNFMQYQKNMTKPMPRHFQEALLVFLSTKPAMEITATRFGISKETINRYKSFYQSFIAKKVNPQAAYRDLYQEYGNTFWFFLAFNRPR